MTTTTAPNPKAIDTAVGHKVRLALNMATPRMSYPAAAELLGVSRDYVRRRVQGEYAFTYSDLCVLAFHLKVDVNTLTDTSE